MESYQPGKRTEKDTAMLVAAVSEATGRSWRSHELEVTRLVSNTNRVFAVVAGQDKLIVRLAGEGTAQYLGRHAELYNARVAAEAGVSAEVVFASVERGIMVTRFIEDSVSMSPERFLKRDRAPSRAAQVLRRIHTCSRNFEGVFDFWVKLERYGEIVREHRRELPFEFVELVNGMEQAQSALDVHGVLRVPCHCDPVPENFLDNGKRMWLVDWEYAGMNDPFWDLGQLSMEGHFGHDQDLEMLEAWLGNTPQDQHIGRLHIYKALCNTLWTLWGVIQSINGNPANDFESWARNRLLQALSEVRHRDWAHHLAMVAAKPIGFRGVEQ